MDFIILLTDKTITILAPVFLFFSAAIYIYWKSDSLYPINMRLLRFFISKNDIEDQTIRKHVSDQAALITFRVAFGVKAHTLSDAKKVANFAENRNISLNLIGKADKAFNLRTCSIDKKEVPKRISCHLLTTFSLIPIVFIVFFAALATTLAISNHLIVIIKETGTWVYLSHNEAKTANPFREQETINIENCSAKKIVAEKKFNKRDHKILCEIWKNPSMKDIISENIDEQNKASLIIIIALLFVSTPLINTTRNGWATIKLHELIGNDK
ncbi:hypothetical protein FUT69_07905 [Xylella taiwanensis]|uniref:Uncharacterized protein n=2 Tax=Xylella taiwanensis TaxID=1444770 RepID=Z9JJ26_9GAMM|nr:DUF6216 family protein [Xylella taiwanensis]AXI83628.1 hypothetical protein AB672_06625 [Xylella taiwanensis]EWS77762.1 hypothetical protein AF72_09020 [Xylella taiwanensis]NBI37085.1 hypothetical protein [Xylella taiwanensis]QKD98556.1 hypothetical protein PLS229_06640 [Xylella taiwanensis]UFM93819.1 DUF6216 family protein [Xylella taiwanensis]